MTVEDENTKITSASVGTDAIGAELQADVIAFQSKCRKPDTKCDTT